MLNKAFRSALSLLLAFCLLLGTSANGLIVWANNLESLDKDGDGQINYVSLGDSMTNGYGLPGYDHNSGVEDYAEKAYPNLFAAWLAEEGDVDVDHAQLAMSGIRTEDMHWLLELNYNDQDAIDFITELIEMDDDADDGSWWTEEIQKRWNDMFGCGDFWTLNEICNHSRTDATYVAIVGGTYESVTHDPLVDSKYYPSTVSTGDGVIRAEKIAVIAKYYQEKVAAADIISLSVGNGNVGVFGFGRILETVGFNTSNTYKNYNYEDVLRECEPELQEKLMAMIEEIKGTLAGNEMLKENPDLQNVVLYIAVSLAMNYAGTVDAILQMNPDVDIVLVPVMNVFGEATEVTEGHTPVASLMGLVIDPINQFIAGLPTYMQLTNHEAYAQADFFYANLDAKTDKVECMVEVYAEMIKTDGSSVRDRFFKNIVGQETPASKQGMVWGLMGGMELVPGITLTYGFTLDDVAEYEAMSGEEKAAYAADNQQKAVSIAVYLAFEDAIIKAGLDSDRFTLEAVQSLGGGLSVSLFTPVISDFMDNVGTAGADYAENATAATATILQATLKGYGLNAIIEAADIKAILEDNASTVVDDIVDQLATANIGTAKETARAQVSSGMATLLNLVENNIVTELADNSVTGVTLGLTTDGYLTAAGKEDLCEAILADKGNWSALSKYISDALPEAVSDLATTIVNGVFDNEDVQDGLTQLVTGATIATDDTAAKVAATDVVLTTIKNQLEVDDAKVALTGMLESNVTQGNIDMICMLLAIPGTLSDSLLKVDNVHNLLTMYSRCMVADGLGGHPSEIGHKTLAAAVIAAYEGDYTAEDKTDENIDFEDAPVVKEIISYLTAEGYLTDAQILAIAFEAYELYKDDMKLSNSDAIKLSAYVYEVLALSLDAETKIEMMAGIYFIILNNEENKEAGAMAAVENLRKKLVGLVTAAEAAAITDKLYEKAVDGEITAKDLYDLFGFTYRTIFGVAAATPASVRMIVTTGSTEKTPEQKLAIIDALYQAVLESELLDTNDPSVQAATNLYNNVLQNPDIPAEERFEIVNIVIETATNSGVQFDGDGNVDGDIGTILADVAKDAVESLLSSDKISADTKLTVAEKVTESFTDVTIPGMEGMGGTDVSEYVSLVREINANLIAAGYLLDEESNAIIERVVTAAFAGTIANEAFLLTLAEDVYFTLFGDQSMEGCVDIVKIIYNTLANKSFVDLPNTDEMYDYVIDLGKEIQGILDTNLAPVVKELRTDLYELYLELDTLTNTLNNELYKVVEAQREVLEGLNAERAALVAELENLQRQLDAIRNPGAGTYGVQSTRNSVEDLAAELEAAIAETEAAIAALDGSIAALNAKIEADLQGIEEIEAAIAQIRAEIRETETALDAVVDAIEQLNADLEVVYNASLVLNEALENVYNLTLDKIDGKAVVEAVKAIIETVPAIVENLEAAYEQAQVAAEKAQAAIDLLKNFNIQDNVDAIVGGVEDLAGLTEDQIELIQAAAAEAQAKAETLVKEHQPKIEDALKATYTELKAVVIREITAAQTWVENNETTLMLGAGAIALVLLPYMDEYVEYNQETGEITIHDDKAIEDLKAFIQPYTSKIDAEILKLQGKAEEARKWLEENYPIAKEKLNNKLDDLREELENLDIEFENPYEDEYLAAKAAIEAEIKKVEDMIDVLEAKAQEVEDYLNTVLAAIDEVEVALDAVIAAGHVVDGDLVALFDALTKLHDELVDLHDAVVTLHDATVEELFEIFGYCGIVADNFVKVLNTLPAYVNVLKHAVELVTSAEFWGGMHEQLMQLMGEYADRLKDFLSEAETQELILNLLKQYGPVVAEKLLDVLAYLVEEYGHDVAVAFYNYLYNNPEEVIAFFNEYGDEMLDLTKEYGDEALLVVAFALVVYGEDLATYVIENHEAILANLAYWWNIHDEKVFALLQVYAEALGLCEPVRQEIAALREALANLKAELEALKADLENASEAVKAEIEAKIAMIEAAIAEVEAAIAELEAALKAAYETGLANIEALKAAIENLDEKVLELLDAAKKAAIDEINAAIAEVEAAIAGLDAALANLLGDVYEQLKDLLISAANMLLDAVIEAVKEYAPKLADDIYNYLYHNPDEVIAFFNEYGDEIWALVEKYGDEALMAVGAVLYLYGEEIAAYIIENQEQLLMAIANWISVHGENAAELLQVYAEALGLCDLVRGEIAKLEALLAELEAKLGELEAELARLQAELEKATDAMKPVIEAAIADVETLIAEIKAAIDEIKAVLPVLNEKLQDLVDALFGLDEALQNLLEIGFDAGALALQQALNAVADAVEALVGVVSDATAEELRKLIDEAKEFLNKAYFDATHTDYVINYDSYYVGLGDDMSVADGYVELLANELGVDFNNLSVPGLSMTDLLYILDEDFVADEYTLAKFAIIYQETGYTVEQMRAVYTAELAKADLVSVGVGSFGITDLIYSQAQGALATILREQMGDYLNNPVIGDYIREILTGYGLNLEATTYTMDWISYIGEDGVAELNEILADVRADLIAKGIPETFTYDFGAAVNEHIGLNFIQPGELEVTIPVADLITMMAESYMYAYVTHLFNAGEVFNSIHEITPNAELLVIGMFNPMDEVVLNFGETTIALGDYYTYMVDVMNLRYLGYAFVVPQTTFVAVPDTMTTVEENVENYADLAQMLMALALNNANVETDVVPTVGGHEYIKEQILNALNVTYGGLLGDVNEDGVVDIVDAWLVMQYDAWIKDEDDLNLALADVNGDGEVDILDAWLIMQYDAWIIDKFPVEP